MMVSKVIINTVFKTHVGQRGIPGYLKRQTHFPQTYLTLVKRSFATANLHCLPVKKYEVNSFGTFELKSEKINTISIFPIDPVECPDQNISSIAISGGKDNANLNVEEFVHQTERGIFFNDHALEDQNLKLDVLLPIKFDINIDATNLKNLSIKNFENGTISANGITEKCYLQNIKSGCVNISTSGGDIESVSTLQADGVLQTHGRGKITLNKPVGEDLNIHTEEGDVLLHDTYSRSLHVSTKTGDVTIGNAHRSVHVDISQKGKLKIDTLDGTLDARVKSGFVDVYVSQHDNVNVQMESGDMVLKLDNSKKTELSLTAKEIITDEQFDINNAIITGDNDNKTLTGYIEDSLETPRPGRKVVEIPAFHKSFPKINARTKKGSIVLKCRDWLSALKLG